MKKSRQQEIEELQEKVFGKSAPKRNIPTSMKEMMEEARKSELEIKKAEDTNAKLNEILLQQMKDIEAMNASISQSLDTEPLKPVEVENVEEVKSIENLEETLNQKIIGQKDAIQAITKAIKRPMILKNENKDSLNSILILGPKGSGKHEIVEEIGKYFHYGIEKINLSAYTTQEDENLFLQDIYASLTKRNTILLFENPEKCFSGYLPMVSQFFKTGRIDLKKRYTESKGQLVEITSGMSTNPIRCLSAQGHYLILVSDLKKNKIVDLLGLEFMNSLSDIIETKSIQENLDDWIQKYKEVLFEQLQTMFEVEFDASIHEYYKKAYNPFLGIHSLEEINQEILHSISQYKLENEDVQKIKLSYENTIMIEVNDTKRELFSIVSKVETVDLETIKKELNEIVGLQEVKQYVLSLEDNYKIQKLREKQGLKTASISKHMIFTGNPGTGKTTIARLIGQYLRAIGILSGGQLIEVTRADLVGRYVGHTAPLTTKVVQSALGGVLFIDEAYSLYRGKEDSFGLECIDTIVKAIEDNRDNLIVILAGYKKEMNEFLDSNSGLKSRFSNIIDFKDYTADELVQISYSIAKSKDYYIDDECKEPLYSYYEAIQSNADKMSGNGRLARNKVEEAIRRQSSRLVKEENPNLQELKLCDFLLDENSFVQ